MAGVRVPPENNHPTNELAELAARFSSRSNGGLSAELAAELALEILLNEIAEQACLATGATGAAIALQRDGEMVCRATSGLTAPDLGSRVDLMSGLSGKCVQTRQTQRCEDVLADPQADAAASERLGVRSVIVMPLLRGQELIGVFELFAGLPFAFGETDETILQGFAQRALNNIERSKQPLETEPEIAEIAVPATDVAPYAVTDPVTGPPRSGLITWMLVGGIVITAMLLGMALGRHEMLRKVMVKAPATSRVIDHAASEQTAAEGNGTAKSGSNSPSAAANPNQGAPKTSIPPGSLVVYENGKQIFRVPPAEKTAQEGLAEQSDGVERASSVNKDSAAGKTATNATLVDHVDPVYPEAARRQGIYGAVVLDVYIAQNGTVQGVQVVSGPPELTDPSITAVKQWRFKPLTVSGHPAEMQTRVTLNFVLPK